MATFMTSDYDKFVAAAVKVGNAAESIATSVRRYVDHRIESDEERPTDTIFSGR